MIPSLRVPPGRPSTLPRRGSSSLPGWFLAVAAACALVLPGESLRAQPVGEPDTAPNELCLGADPFGDFGLPFAFEDSLEEGDASTRIDFHTFEAEPGLTLVVELQGQASGMGTLEDPLLGIFDSGCDLLEANDDFFSTDSRVEFVVPPDGIFIVAATAYADFGFDGSGDYMGTYTVTFDVPPPSIGSITLRIVDADTGAPLPGDTPPYANALLIGCSEEAQTCDRYYVSLNANDEGHITFDETAAGQRLPAGDYLLEVQADGYRNRVVGPFAVVAGQAYDLGDVALEPPPVSIVVTRPCTLLPPQGTVCDYAVTVANNTGERLRALAWSVVDGYGIGSELDYTLFEADVLGPAGTDDGSGGEGPRRASVQLDADADTTLRFRVDVPSFVDAYASLCARLMIGLSPDPLFNTIKDEDLFCLQKMPSGFGFRVLSVAERRKLLARTNGHANVLGTLAAALRQGTSPEGKR